MHRQSHESLTTQMAGLGNCEIKGSFKILNLYKCDQPGGKDAPGYGVSVF